MSHCQGLSPLARGNQDFIQLYRLYRGPIPARAGEPFDKRLCAPSTRAYPRSRGGTARRRHQRQMAGGLSPLARGNLRYGNKLRVLPGPIPARAGEPLLLPRLLLSTRAYPRSRGGTEIPDMVKFLQGGLSPLARGNLGQNEGRAEGLGPIPARAGEPLTLNLLRRKRK